MTKETLLKELINRGFEAEAIVKVKNGVRIDAVTVKNGTNIAPSIDTAPFLKEAEENGLSNEETIEKFLEIVKNYQIERDIDANKFFEKEYLLDHINIGIQPVGSEDLIKKDTDLEGIEQYLYVTVADEAIGKGSIKLKPDMLNYISASEDELWDAAESNLIAESTEFSLGNMLFLTNLLDYDTEQAVDKEVYVVSNFSRIKGAASILHPVIRRKMGRILNASSLIVLPSSIHEVLVMNASNKDLEEMTAMVQDVNKIAVEPTEILANQAFIIDSGIEDKAIA